MDALTNVQIGNDNPSQYIARFSKDNTQLASVLKSHYIDEDAGILEDDYETFIRKRSRGLYDALMSKLVLCSDDKVTHSNH